MDTQIPIRITSLEAAIAQAANITVEQMRSHKRDRPLAEARMAVWYIAHDHMGFSYLRIAKVYGRDHTTIISGVRKMRAGKAGKHILEGIRKAYPEILDQPAPGEARTVENWRF